MDVDLSVELCGIEFKNPILASSATPTKNAKFMKKALDVGAAGIIAKTVSYEKLLQRYVRPRFTVLRKKGWPHCFSNYSCEFLATYTPDEWVKEIKEAKKYSKEANGVLIASISGSNLESWSRLARMMEEAGADMLELNFGCPHPRGMERKMGVELGQDAEASAEVVKVVKEAVSIPVFTKLTAEAVDVVKVAKAVEGVGADGLTAINRYSALDVDIERGRPLLHSTYAGVGGPWMLPITLKWITKLAMAVKIPISATNGVWKWKDVVKCIMCGAFTVQTCTAIMYGGKGYSIIKEYIDGLRGYLESKGYDKLDDIKGITLKQIIPFDKVDRETKVWAVSDEEKCDGCQLCLNWCFYGAISMVSKNGKKVTRIRRENCDGCGLCVALCPASSIFLEGAHVYLGDFE